MGDGNNRITLINTLKKLLDSSKGIGLTEAIIGIGLLGGVGLMAMRLSSNEAVFKTKAKGTNAAEDITQVIKNQLEDPRVCRENLETNSAAASSFPKVVDQSGTTVFEKNKIYEGVIITDLRLRGGGNDGTYFVSGDHGFTNVEIFFSTPGAKPGAALVKKRFPIWVKLDASDRIETCGSINLMLNSLWLRSFTNPMNITYQAGSVGINTSSPTLMLDVQGPIRASNAAGDELLLNSSPTGDYRLTLLDNLPLTIKNNALPGDIVVRGLLVGDMVRPTGNIACNASSEGSTRYNTSNRRLELCVKNRSGSGHSWIHFLE